MMAMVDVVSQLPTGGPMAQVRGLGPRVSAGFTWWMQHSARRPPSRRRAGTVLHSSREPGVWRPCRDFMDMLQRLI